MSAVDDRFHSVPPGHLADGFHRRDLSGDINLMSDLDQTSAWRNRVFERGSDFFNVLWWNRDSYQVELYAFALFTLADRRQHPSVILSGRQNFIAGFEIHSEQQCFISLMIPPPPRSPLFPYTTLFC